MRLSEPTVAASGLSDSAGIAGARCGTPYDSQVQVGYGLRVIAVQIFDADCGLQADRERPGRVYGVPSRAGQVSLQVKVQDRGGQQQLLQVQLNVSADPRSLWKDLPSDPQLPFQKATLDSQWLPAAGVELLGASCRGRMHAQKAGFREDDFRIGWLPGDLLVLIAADGAGSASLSRLGSKLAVEAALGRLQAALADDSAIDPSLLLTQAAHAALAALEHHAGSTDTALAELNTTLLIALTSAAAPHTVTALQIGDGLIAALSASGGWSGPLCDSDHGEFHGQTRFLSAQTLEPSNLAARIRVHRCEQLRYLLVATDGIVDPYFETEFALMDDVFGQQFIDRLNAAVDGATPLVGLQEWLADFTPGHHDDRTLALARWPLR